MKTRIRRVAGALVATVFFCASATALAMPKAAEDESAEVSSGANAARPKHSSAKPPATVKAKPAKKSSKPVKKNASSKKSKTTQGRK